MNESIEHQTKELVKLIVSPVYEIENLMDDEYYLLEEEFNCPKNSHSHFEAESELLPRIEDIQDYEDMIKPVLIKISDLSNGAYEKDPIAYLKPYIEIPDCLLDSFRDRFSC